MGETIQFLVEAQQVPTPPSHPCPPSTSKSSTRPTSLSPKPPLLSVGRLCNLPLHPVGSLLQECSPSLLCSRTRSTTTTMAVPTPTPHQAILRQVYLHRHLALALLHSLETQTQTRARWPGSAVLDGLGWAVDQVATKEVEAGSVETLRAETSLRC